MKNLLIVSVLILVMVFGFYELPDWIKLLVTLATASIVVNLFLRMAAFMANTKRAKDATFGERLANAAGYAMLRTFRENNGWWCIVAVMFVFSLVGGINAGMHRSIIGEANEQYENLRSNNDTAQQWSNWVHNKGFKTDADLGTKREYHKIERSWYDWPWGWTTFWLGILTLIMIPLVLMDEGEAALKRISQKMRQKLHAGDIALKDHWWDQMGYHWISSYSKPPAVVATAAPASGPGSASASAVIHTAGQGAARGFFISLVADLLGEMIGGIIEKEKK